MKIIKTTFFLTLFLLSAFSYGQLISPDVLASAGNHFSGGDAQISWTIGEIVTETVQRTNTKLTQGFHQTNLTITMVFENDHGIEIKVYPNPVKEILFIDLEKPVNNLKMIMLDATGTPVWKNEINGQRRIKINSSYYSPGLYFLKIVNSSGTINKMYKIIKTK